MGAEPRSRAERYEAGKLLRARAQRTGHADYAVRSDRDPVAILQETDSSRITSLLPIRYERMAVSPFTFLRGAAAVMAADLATLPAVGVPVQACGDCHLMNFGAFSTPEDKVLFDINDFDETRAGVDFTVDLKRLVASVAVAALDHGLSDRKARQVALATAGAYRGFVRDLAAMTPLEVWHVSMDLRHEAERFGGKLRDRILGALLKAEKDLQADDNFPHLGAVVDGHPRIQDRPPTIYHFDPGQGGDYGVDIQAMFAHYRRTLWPERRALVERYEAMDTAFKVVGVGSVGTFCAITLFSTADGGTLFLQIKEAQASVLERLGLPPVGPHQMGRRVVQGQRAMQAAADVFLGWTADRATGRQFYVRQLKNRRLGSIGEVMEGDGLSAYATLCGRTLARAHARTGDPACLAGYMGKSDAFDDALASFAMTYAKQTAQDHAALLKAMPQAAAAASAAGKA